MKNVREILDEKGRQVHTIGPDQTVYEAIERMAEVEVGALPVVEEGRLVGIISERDYARKVILAGRSSRHTPVRDVMTPGPVSVGEDISVEACMALMTHKRFRHLPVLRDGKLVGIVSLGDLVRAVIAEQEMHIRHLEAYIYGRYPA